MKFLVLLGIVCLIGVATGQNLSARDKECIDNYLTSGSWETQECGAVVKGYLTNFNNDLLARQTAEDNHTCIQQQFDDYRVANWHLKGLSYTLGAGSFAVDASESKRKILNAVKSICTANENYGKEFDELSKPTGRSLHAIGDACFLQYFLAEKIVDAAELDINLTSVDTKHCVRTESISEYRDYQLYNLDTADLFMFGMPASLIQKCFIDKKDDERIALKIASCRVFRTYKLSQENMLKLRDKYVGWKTAESYFLLDCTKDFLLRDFKETDDRFHIF